MNLSAYELEARVAVLEKLVEKQGLIIEVLARVYIADNQENQEVLYRIGQDIGKLQRAVFPQRN